MQKPIAITNGTVYTGSEVLHGKSILIEKDKIAALVSDEALPKDMQRIDVGGCHIAPGLIDLQIYGGGGYLFSAEPSAQAMDGMAGALLASGTTRFMLTLATNTDEVFNRALEVVQQHSHPALLGLHFEGPYLNPDKRGAHPEYLMRSPEKKELQRLLDRAKGHLKMITVAPERVSADCTDLLLEAGVLVSAGHSTATYSEATGAFDRGVQAATHLFNAMSAFHHRETGLPGAVFQHGKACASIIADGIHVDYQAVAISKKLLGERLFLITDAVEACDTGIYQHERRGDRFTMPDGTLSGSALTLLQAVANCVRYAGIPLDEALRMATLYPARLIGAMDIGQIAVGYQADIVVFDAEYHVQQVFLGGEKII